MIHIVNDAIKSNNKPWVTIKNNATYYSSSQDHIKFKPETLVWYKDGSYAEFDIVGVIDGLDWSYAIQHGLGTTPLPTIQIKNIGDAEKIIIGTNVTDIKRLAFIGCYNIQYLAICNSLKTLDLFDVDIETLNITNYANYSNFNWSFSNCITSKDNPKYYAEANSLINKEDNSVIRIFSEFSTGEVTISNKATVIKANVIENASNSNITTINMPTSILSIEKDAFLNAKKFKRINYSGTKSLFLNITIDTSWHYSHEYASGFGNYYYDIPIETTIYCTDGVIKYNLNKSFTEIS